MESICAIASAALPFTLSSLNGTAPGDLPVEFPTKVGTGHQSEDGQDARPGLAAAPARPRRRGDRIGHGLLRCMSPEVAHRVNSPRRINSVAIGGIADMPRSPVAPPGDANA